MLKVQIATNVEVVCKNCGNLLTTIMEYDDDGGWIKDKSFTRHIVLQVVPCDRCVNA